MTSPDFRALFESSPGCSLVFSPDLRVVAVSDAYLKASGTRREELLDRGILDLAAGHGVLLRVSDLDDLKASLLRVLEQRAADVMPVLAVDIPAAGGGLERKRWSRVNLPLLDAQGRIVSILHHLEDITQAALLQEQAADALQELESFSYSISHDLRAPLRAIHGFSRILVEEHAGALSAEGRRVAGVITDSAVRLSGLIDSVLEFSRLGRKEMTRAAVDMTQLAREVLDELLAQAPGRKIETKVDALPPASGDRILLRQVWANLIGNAVKYTGKRPVAHIEIGGSRGPGLNRYWVKDDGAGFSMDHAHKLFVVFQRLHSPKEFPGNGVGLALVQRIVDRHGGRISAEGVPNGGATFTFTLPPAQ